ncbi:sialate O-acetylesterase [Verrucomicrobiota bacterium]
MNKYIRIIMLIAMLAFAAGSVCADVKLNGLFTDNMVIQRDTAAPVWGRADPGEEVTVTGSWGQSVSTKAGEDGNPSSPGGFAAARWMVKLQTPEAGSGHSITVKGNNIIELKNVASGDVWLCSGQSNMAFQMLKFIKVHKNSRLPEVVAMHNSNLVESKHPNVRVILLDKRKNCQKEPQEEFVVDALFKNSWQPCVDPKITAAASAVGFHFGHKLQSDLNIPIGLINSSVGGTAIVFWTPLEGMMHETNEKVRARAGLLYNSMITPLMPFAIKGVIWYQGENDAGSGSRYAKPFSNMITVWRKKWGQGDFPFLFVQLAAFHEAMDEAVPQDARWPYIREAQAKALSLPNVGMASAIDLGTQKDIHPWNKGVVGHRLAAEAKRIAYGRDIVSLGPLYESIDVKDGKVVVKFKHVGSGLIAKDVDLDGIKVSSDEIKGFAICGEDRKFVHAEAEIDGDTIVVSNTKVANPVAVRYAWADFPICNLYNNEGFPANPFRTDDFVDQKKK